MLNEYGTTTKYSQRLYLVFVSTLIDAKPCLFQVLLLQLHDTINMHEKFSTIVLKFRNVVSKSCNKVK